MLEGSKTKAMPLVLALTPAAVRPGTQVLAARGPDVGPLRAEAPVRKQGLGSSLVWTKALLQATR